MKMVSLSSIAQVIAGQSPPSSTYNTKGEGLPFFQGKADFKDKYPITRMWCSSAQVKIAEPGDILISVRAPVGAVNVCNQRSVIGRGLSAIRAKDALYNEYLYYFLKANEKNISKLGTGSTFLAITQETLKKIQIPLPPLEDQKRIAYLLGKVEGLIAQRKQDLQQLDDLLKSVFIDMFGFADGTYVRYDIVDLQNISHIVSGVTKGKKYKDEDLYDVPYMRVANVQDGYFNLNEIKTIKVSQKEMKQYELRKGDLLLTEGGDPDKLGRGAVWNNEIENCIHQNHIFRVRINKTDQIEPYYLSSLISSLYGKSYFLKSAKQTTGIASINSTQLKHFPVIIPPLDLQNRFAEIVEKVELIKQHYQTSLHDLEQLYGSLSQRAFKGELDLSRVPLLASEDELPNASEPSHTTVVEGPNGQAKFQLAVPANPQDLIGKRTREQLINQWLDHYLSQLKAGEDIDITEFIQVVNTVIGEAQQQTDDSEQIKEFGVADYTIVQEALFARLEQNSIRQVYPEPDPEGSDELQIKRVILQQSTLGI
jgi:type I restriction enzyme S subunit